MHSRTIGALAGPLLALVLGGCGGGDDASPAPQGGTGDTTPPPAPVSSLPTLGSPVAVVTPDSGLLDAPRMALEGRSGTVFVTWTEGSDGRDGLYFSRYVENNGFWDPQPVRLDGGEGRPLGAGELALDDKGSVLVVWPEQEAGQYRLRSRYRPFSEGGAWHALYYGSGSDTGDVSTPLMAVEANNRYIVTAWIQQGGTVGHLWSNRYKIDLSGTWEGAVVIDTDLGDVTEAELVIDGSDIATLAWVQSDGSRRNLWFARNNPADGSWSTAARVDPASTLDVSELRLAVDPNGDLIALWLADDGTRPSLLASRYSGGAWSTPASLDGGGEAATPRLVIDGNGDATALWIERDSSGAERLVARRYDRTTALWGSTETVALAGEAIHFDRLVIDAGGNVTALWRRDAGGRLDLWSNRYATGSGWGQARRVEGYDEGDAETPLVVVDSAGNITALWRHWHEGAFHLLASRYTLATDLWSTPSKVDHANHSGADLPQLVVTGSGTATALWRQPMENGRQALWANRF